MASALGIAPDEPDQVLRLGRFREEHPDVIIGDAGFGTFTAAVDRDLGCVSASHSGRGAGGV
jgi:hypothetical protein